MYHLRLIFVFILFLNFSISCSIFQNDETLDSGDQTPETSTLAVPEPAKSGLSGRIVVSDQDLEKALEIVRAEETVLNNIYQDLLLSVVHVEIKRKVNVSGYGRNESQEYYLPGDGSGFLWSQDGYIVTNHHVVADADIVNVIFYDGLSLKAEVVGIDPDSDLAVLKTELEPGRYRPVSLGDSNIVRVGELAAAIGTPFGQDFTLTSGIISAVGRSIQGDSQYSIPEAIQTDASINPGNSGGPLLNRKGQVIGINSQIITTSNSSAGIGFAVPVNIAKKVIPDLILYGKHEYAWLGVEGFAVGTVVAEALGLDRDTRGAFISGVVEGGPAEKAGLRGSSGETEIEGSIIPIGGDIIVAINGREISGVDDVVSYLINEGEPGGTHIFTVIRDKELMDVSVTLGTRPSR